MRLSALLFSAHSTACLLFLSVSVSRKCPSVQASDQSLMLLKALLLADSRMISSSRNDWRRSCQDWPLTNGVISRLTWPPKTSKMLYAGNWCWASMCVSMGVYLSRHHSRELHHTTLTLVCWSLGRSFATIAVTVLPWKAQSTVSKANF